MLALATRVVEDFGRTLAGLDKTAYGYPESLLPHDKSRIRAALRTLLKAVGNDPQVGESLARAYVYLAQFVADEDAALIQASQTLLSGDGQSSGDLSEVAVAMQRINEIKLAMEKALSEVEHLRQGSNP